MVHICRNLFQQHNCINFPCQYLPWLIIQPKTQWQWFKMTAGDIWGPNKIYCWFNEEHDIVRRTIYFTHWFVLWDIYYTFSKEIWTWFALCFILGYVVVDFTHIRQGCWAVECWAKCQRRNFQSNELKNHLQYIQNKAEHSNILCIP